MSAAARLPSVDRVLCDPLARALSAEYGASATAAAVRAALRLYRRADALMVLLVLAGAAASLFLLG